MERNAEGLSDELEKVKELLRQGRKQKALRKLRALRDKHQEDIEFRKNALRLAHDAGYYEDALEDAWFLVAREGDDESKLFVVDCLVELERYQEAEEALLKFSDLRNRSPSYHLFFGLVKLHTGRNKEANEEFERVFSVKSEGKVDWFSRMMARFFMAVNFLAMGKTKQMRKQARLAGREAQEREPFFKALRAIDSYIIRYEAISECVRAGKIERNQELIKAMEEMRLLAEMEEVRLTMLQEDKGNH
ncbi:MAG: hypothetical protein ABIM46_03305 [candidate division WOR-3 bacterium]